MKREEIIQGLYRGDSKAIKEAIKVLEQQPCEDAISREDVIKAVDHHTFDTDDGLCLDEDISIILEELPPVTLKAECSCDQIKWERDMAIAQLNELGYGLGEKPRTGHWIDMGCYHLYNDEDVETTLLQCSNCKEVIEWNIESSHKPYYCKNCGTKMIESKKSEE